MKQKSTFLKVFMTLLLLCGVSSVWGEEVTLASWTFTSGTAGTNYPSDKTNFSATGGSCTSSTFYLNGSGSTWNTSKGYAFTAVTDIIITINASEAIAKGTKITFKVTTFYNKASNAPMTGFNLTCKEGSGSFGTTGLSATSWSLSNSSAEKTVVYMTQNDITKDGTIALKLTQTGKEGAGQGYMGPIVVTSEAAATEPCTVTFNAGTNGTCTTTSSTETSANAGVTLPACTANDGYVFKGWAEEGGNVVGQAGDTYKPGSNCTLNAVYNKTYVLTITQPADGGTLTVKNGDTQLETGANVEVGTNLTCEVTEIPEGKRFSRFYAKWGEEEKENKYKGTNPATFENLTKDVLPADISALELYVDYQDLKKYTINYMVNGVNTNAQENVYEGTPLVFPTVSSFGGKDFIGWVEQTIETPTDDEPTFIVTSNLTATGNKTYYATFVTTPDLSGFGFILSNEAPVAGDKVIIAGLNNGKYYALKSNITASELTVVNNKVTNESLSDLTWTASEQTVSEKKGIAFAVGTGTPLHINSKEVKCASGYANGTFDFTTDSNGGFQFHGNQNNRWLKFNGTSFTYSTEAVGGIYFFTFVEPVYTGYCTTVTPLTQDVTITSAGYATAYVPFAATVTGATAYYVTVEDNKAKLHEIDGTIPANTGVVLKGAAGTATFTESAVAPVRGVDGNLLVGTTQEGGDTFGPDDKTYYILSTGANGVGFYWDALTNNSGASAKCAQYKAVLAVPTTVGGIKSFFSLDDETTSIHNSQFIIHNSENVMYNLNGQVVGKDYKGIVIVNGKKMLNK